MSNVVIRVEDLSKQYRLGLVGSGTLQDDFTRWWATIRGKEDPFLKIGESNDRSVKGQSDYVWSLKDINFEVRQGEVLGIIGRNGAGKSTLLKILSKVTAPTTGSVKIKGRIASLLEVGTGFHPELTGRENIFLNGAILGMKRQEITKKLDEIIAFSGVERYIDTPVKRYSSGMYVRLAFAVAAHLESEILIIDEVLAVGDLEFQKKCIGKMGEVSKGEGRTVLFVSHNMGTIAQLCSTSILLSNGQIQYTGNTQNVIENYLSSANLNDTNEHIITEKEKENKKMFFSKVFTTNIDGKAYKKIYTFDENIYIKLHITIIELCPNAMLGIGFQDKYNNRIFTLIKNMNEIANKTGDYVVNVKIPSKIIAPNVYSFVFAMSEKGREFYHLIDNQCGVKIIDNGTEFSHFEGIDYGSVILNANWTVQNN